MSLRVSHPITKRGLGKKNNEKRERTLRPGGGQDTASSQMFQRKDTHGGRGGREETFKTSKEEKTKIRDPPGMGCVSKHRSASGGVDAGMVKVSGEKTRKERDKCSL